MPQSRTEKGRFFEKLAKDYLLNQGYKIIAQNFQSSHKELDIICSKDEVIHFVEVKGRTSKRFGEITETITKKKKENLLEAAQMWVQENSEEGVDWQIDFLGVENPPSGKLKFTFIQNAIN